MRSNRRDFMRKSALLSLSACFGAAGASSGESSGEVHLATNQYPWTVFYDRDKEEFDMERVLSEVAAAGFTNAYNITDGMEGDVVSDPNSVFQGQRWVNGWKNSGGPWTKKLTPERMVLPEHP